jgi:uncharacterized phage-associated protein
VYSSKEENNESDSENESKTNTVREANNDSNDGNTKNELRKLHRVYGHMSYTQIHKLIKSNAVNGLSDNVRKANDKIIKEMISEKCEGCLRGNSVDHR